MTLSLSVLGSGSSGNCTALILEGGPALRVILLDAGLSPRETGKRLHPLGIELEQVERLLITHFDHDHFHRGWPRAMRKLDVTVHGHDRHRRRAVSTGVPVQRLATFETGLELDGDTRIDAVLCAHDALGTAAYVVEHGDARLGYATDLGRVPERLFKAFTDLDALAIESNYDLRMQMTSPRPATLKRRITGGLGHLSNEQALDAVRRVTAASDLDHLVLLHLSRQCNDPRLVTDLYASQAPPLLDRLTITNQYVPSPVLHVHGRGDRVHPPRHRLGQQMMMFETKPAGVGAR